MYAVVTEILVLREGTLFYRFRYLECSGVVDRLLKMLLRSRLDVVLGEL